MAKILQICVEGNTGSTGRIAEEIGRMAISSGWDSYICHGRFARKSESKIIRIGTDFDVIIHGLQTRFFDRHGLGSKHATKELVNKIIEINPDVIHLHHLHGYYINIRILFNYLQKTNKPVVWTFHDCWSITGHCCYFDYIGCNKWKTECFNCPQKREYPASYLLDRSQKNFRHKKELFTSVPNMTIVSVSKWLNDIVHNSFMGKIPSQVIYNGVDIDIFTPIEDQNKIKEKLNIVDKFMILGVANPWSKRKGLQDFVELSKKVNDDIVIVLVALNNQQIKKLPKNIIGLNKTENQKELSSFYASADLFMNLSVEETFGLTTAEALSCGTPAVVYDATACPEIIDLNTGIIVNKKDIKSLVIAINTIRNKGKNTFSLACRERAVKYFNKNDRFMEYLKLYNNLIIDK